MASLAGETPASSIWLMPLARWASVSAARWSLVTIWWAMRFGGRGLAVGCIRVDDIHRDAGQPGFTGGEGAALPVTDFDAGVGADRGEGLQHTRVRGCSR